MTDEVERTARRTELAETETIAATIRDLLTIARIAMPPDLAAIDPRIIKAEALLARLEGKIQ